MRRITALLGGVAVVATVGLSAAAPAMASTAHPAAHHAATRPAFNPGDDFSIGPGASNLGNSFETEGVNAQIQDIADGPHTEWDTTAATTGYKIMPNGDSSHCLEADANNQVRIQNCASGRNTQWWTFSGSGSTVNIQNVNTGGYVGVFDPNDDKPVYDEGKATGYYTGMLLGS